MAAAGGAARLLAQLAPRAIEDARSLRLVLGDHGADQSSHLVAALPALVVAAENQSLIEVPASEPHFATALVPGLLVGPGQLFPLDQRVEQRGKRGLEAAHAVVEVAGAVAGNAHWGERRLLRVEGV